TRNNITERFAECGLSEVDSSDPQLPRPTVPAHRAYANAQRLAGYHYRSTFGATQEFRWFRSNGAAIAWMTLLLDEEITFGTSTAGAVARMNRFFTGQGEFFNYWCGSTRVDQGTFRQCVEAGWAQ